MGENRRRKGWVMEEVKGEVPVVAEVKISFYQNGQVMFNSTTQDKVMIYGLLEMATEIIRGEKRGNIVQVPGGAIPEQILKGGNS
jgi:hypothetical protein